MEDEELNEEVMGDPDMAGEVTSDVEHDMVDAGETEVSEEPVDCHVVEMDELKQHIQVLEGQISGLRDSISTIIEAGGTVTQARANITEEACEEDEPYMYLEDLDYTI